ncbi:MAG: SDR family oxidoreductase [Luteimonas sp.]
MTTDTTRKIALVTGATRGIGLETARQLAAAGAHVLLAGRDQGKTTAAAKQLHDDGLAVEPIVLDVTDAASIARAVEAVKQTHGRLDILVNNAGIMRDNDTLTPSQQTLQAWRATFDTNLFALVEVTNAFLPLLRASSAGRIVNLSSLLGSVTLHADPQSPIYNYKIPAYNVSKSAVNAWTVHLAHELRDTPIKVNAVHPGSVKTDMNAYGDMDVVNGAKSGVHMALLDADGPSGSFTHLGAVLPW